MEKKKSVSIYLEKHQAKHLMLMFNHESTIENATISITGSYSLDEDSKDGRPYRFKLNIEH